MCSNVDIRNNAIEVPLFIALGKKKLYFDVSRINFSNTLGKKMGNPR